MKAGWQRNKLDKVCHFYNGLWKGKKPPFVNVGVIRNTNFTKEGTLDDTDIAYLDVEAKQFEKRRLKFGDIILEKSGGGPKQPVGRVVLFDKEGGKFSFSNFTSALRVIDSTDLDFLFLHKFLHWTYLSGVTEGMQSHSTGIRNLDGDAYKAIEIVYPPLPEQKRLVGILDQAFAGIATAKANAEKNLQNARALFESHLNEIVTKKGEGWVEKPLLNYVRSVSTGPFGSLLHKSDYVSDGMPLVNPINIVNGTIIPDGDKMVSPATKERLQNYVLQEDDIVVGRRGEIGRCAVVGAEQAGWVCGTGCFFIRPLQTANPYFLAHLIRSRRYREKLEKSSSGATMLNLSNKVLGELPIAIPKLAEQNRILAKLDSLRAETKDLESIYQRKIAALDDLKKSLLHQAFSGQL